MPPITPVTEANTFLDWRNKTNELINTLNMPTNGTIVQLGTRVDTFNITESAGVHIGCVISDNSDGTINISAGEAILRTSNLSSAPLVSVEFPAITNLLLTDTATNFIYADYNNGTPAINFSTLSSAVTDTDRGMIGIVQKNGVKLTILQLAGDSGDFERRITHRLRSAEGFSKSFGSDMSEPSPLRLSIAAGEFYYGISEFATPSINTSTVGTATGTSTGGSISTLIDTTKNFVTEGVVVGDQVWNTTNNEKGSVLSISTTTNPNDTLNITPVVTTMALKNYDVTHADFEYYHNNGAWIETGSSGVDNASWNSFGVGLVAHTASYFKVDWVYLKIGTNKVTPYVLRGIAEYSSLASAQNETEPQTRPYPLATLGVLVGRLITQQGNPNIVSVDNLLNSQNFASSGSTEFTDDVFRVIDNADASKKAGFELSGLTTNTERVFEIPNKNGRLAVYEDVYRRHDEVYKHSSMGALSKRVVPYDMSISYGTFEDETSISINSKTVLSGLGANSVGVLSVLGGDIVESNKPLTVKDAGDGNIIPPLSAVGEHFYFYSSRSAPHMVAVYAPYYDVDVIYSNDTNFAVPQSVWDGSIGGGNQTTSILVKKGTVKVFYVQHDPASIVGVTPPTANPATEIGHHYFHTNGPVVISKEGVTGIDSMFVMPMSREILHPWVDGLGANVVRSFTGTTPTHIGNGYYIGDDQFQTFSFGDGAGANAHTGIPYVMCGDTYMIEHDIAGFQICVIEPCDIRVLCANENYTSIDASLASRTNPLFFSFGNAMSGVPNAVSLLPTVGYIDFNPITSVGTLNVGDTLTQAVSGATATISGSFNGRLSLNAITGVFDVTNLVTSSNGATFNITKTLYRMWSFVATAPFALRVNDAKDDEYIAIGYRRSERTDSFDQTTQLNQSLHSLTDEVQERAPFVTHFDADLDYEWIDRVANSTLVNVNSSSVPTSSGASVREVTGQSWIYYNEKIPFNSDTLYKVSARVRLTALSTVVGQALLSVGVDGYLSDGVTLVDVNGTNGYTNQFFVASASRNLEIFGTNVWVIVEGYFKGHGAYTPNAIEPELPSGLHANVRFFKPVIVVNGGGGGASDATTQIDWMKVEALSNLAAGARGGGSDKVFWENDTIISTDYTISAGKNAMSSGPITINNGVTVTVPNGSTWTVI